MRRRLPRFGSRGGGTGHPGGRKPSPRRRLGPDGAFALRRGRDIDGTSKPAAEIVRIRYRAVRKYGHAVDPVLPVTSHAAIVACMRNGHLRLMGAHEIRIRLGGISRQRVYQITSRPGFPQPVADLAQGKVWLVDDVEAWMVAKRPSLVDSGE